MLEVDNLILYDDDDALITICLIKIDESQS